jgi:hypothetical protein
MAARRIDRGRVHLGPFLVRLPALGHHEGGAAQVADVLHRLSPLARRWAELDQRAFGIAEDQEVGLAVGQHGAAHLVDQ